MQREEFNDHQRLTQTPLLLEEEIGEEAAEVEAVEEKEE
jgi:hypothetical protein